MALAALSLIVITLVVGWDHARRARVQSVIGLAGVSMFRACAAMPVGGLSSVVAIIANRLDPQRLGLDTAT